MLEIIPSRQFKKDLKLAQKRGLPLEKLRSVICTLAIPEPLADNHRDHSLTGTYRDFRECHIQPDWLLIYRTEPEGLFLFRTGSHSDLF